MCPICKKAHAVGDKSPAEIGVADFQLLETLQLLTGKPIGRARDPVAREAVPDAAPVRRNSGGKPNGARNRAGSGSEAAPLRLAAPAPAAAAPAPAVVPVPAALPAADVGGFLFVAWDIENVPMPQQCEPALVLMRLEQRLQALGYHSVGSVMEVCAFYNPRLTVERYAVSASLVNRLHTSGVALCDVGTAQGAADYAMASRVDGWTRMQRAGLPVRAIVLITGDGDFSLNGTVDVILTAGLPYISVGKNTHTSMALRNRSDAFIAWEELTGIPDGEERIRLGEIQAELAASRAEAAAPGFNPAAPCASFATTGFCLLGDSCHKAHNFKLDGPAKKPRAVVGPHGGRGGGPGGPGRGGARGGFVGRGRGAAVGRGGGYGGAGRNDRGAPEDGAGAVPGAGTKKEVCPDYLYSTCLLGDRCPKVHSFDFLEEMAAAPARAPAPGPTPAPAPVPAPAVEPPAWACSVCTFSNDGALSVCEMCEAPKQ